MTALTPFHIGDQVQIATESGPMTGAVVTYRLDGRRQIMTVQVAEGVSHTVVIDLTAKDAGTKGLVIDAVDIGLARALAEDVLSGGRSRMPVTCESRLLAAALLQLSAGGAP